METMNQTILDAFRFRHACKKFDPAKAVSAEDFDTILETARLSPSSFGFEPWKLVVLRDPQIREKLYSFAWGARNSLDGASHFVILLARKKADMLHSSDYITHILRDIQKFPEDIAQSRRKTYENFQENEFRLLESDRAMFDWASKQTYIVLANMLTAAALLRVDACPIEGFDRQKADQLLAEFGVMDQEHFGVSVMAGFGYRAEPPHREKTRQPLSDIVLWK
ncbi:MAG: NAD(P)H-dependent oxidoreductase [Bacillota bacterium]